MTRRLAAAALVVWAAALVAAQTPSPTSNTGDEGLVVLSEDELLRLLPLAPGRETVLRVCASECHAADRVAAHAGNRDYWDRIVQDMTLHGAQFTSDEQEEIVTYLVDQLPEKVDINLLSERLLQTRLMFTPEEAAAIVAWRAANGPIRSLEQLQNIPGVSSEKVRSVSRRLLF
ncbi:MAG: hypothetical protein ABS36_15325 [Acidobacteria bacterium SCN 69-37]|nr:MAG: hypothetical protein ABS36_15325 [Acidobacteria bacterium SCN 69-37]